MRVSTDEARESLRIQDSQARSLAPTAAAMREEIRASRVRSLQFGVQKHRVEPPVRAGAASGNRFAKLAQPVLDRVCDDLLESPLGVVLADKRARIIDRRVIEGAMQSTLDDFHLGRGCDWSERHVGTNAVGTSLAWMAPIIVHGTEHFADALSNVTTAAAPIVDPRTGKLLGAVGLVCAHEDSGVLMLPYARRIAREIEGLLVDDASAAERALLEHFVRTRRCARGAIVSVNQRAMFTNAAAARFVEEADHALLWEWADRPIGHRQLPHEELELTGGTRVTAQCEPVLFGSEVVGALIRLVAGTPVIGRRRRRTPRAGRVGWGSLSAAQLGVAELVAAGLTNQEAATRLYVSPHTIDFHLRQIFNKLGISSRVELARIVTEQRSNRESRRNRSHERVFSPPRDPATVNRQGEKRVAPSQGE